MELESQVNKAADLMECMVKKICLPCKKYRRIEGTYQESGGEVSMRKAVLFIAMSLDGYIADKNGGVDWLTGQDSNAETDDSYAAFEQEIDTVVMGHTTYQQVTTELSPEKWVYENLQSYIITHKAYEPRHNIHFVSANPCTLVKDLTRKSGKDIWICGGAGMIRQLMQENLIDRYHISIIPTILGSGISLFGTLPFEIKLRLVSVKNSNGITELVYEKRTF